MEHLEKHAPKILIVSIALFVLLANLIYNVGTSKDHFKLYNDKFIQALDVNKSILFNKNESFLKNCTKSAKKLNLNSAYSICQQRINFFQTIYYNFNYKMMISFGINALISICFIC